MLFDEVHERSLDSDLALALTLDAAAALRPDQARGDDSLGAESAIQPIADIGALARISRRFHEVAVAAGEGFRIIRMPISPT